MKAWIAQQARVDREVGWSRWAALLVCWWHQMSTDTVDNYWAHRAKHLTCSVLTLPYCNNLAQKLQFKTAEMYFLSIQRLEA